MDPRSLTNRFSKIKELDLPPEIYFLGGNVFVRRLLHLIFISIVAVSAYATTPQVTSTSPTSGPTGTQVQINGSGFGATRGSSAVNFNGSYPATIISWSDSQIVATVPPQAFTGQVVVVVGGVWSNQSVYFNVPAPQITSISPASGSVGTSITINGSGFQASKGANSSISFNGVNATATTSWGDTQIVATVPANATTGAVKITVNGVVSNEDQVFTMPNPVVSGLVPSSGPVGTAVHINGSGFGTAPGTSSVQFNGVTATTTAWSDSSITATVPTTSTSGTVLVTVGGVTTGSDVKFTIPPPQVNSISPTSGAANTQVTVSGSGFQSPKGSGSTLSINGVTATTTSWNDSQIVANVPASTATGPVRVSVNNIASNQDIGFTIPNPIITSISPTTGPVGTPVTVTGTGFGATRGTSTLAFQGLAATITTWSDNQIVATVPTAAMTGYIQVTVLGVNSQAGEVYYTVTPPQITSISPTSGTPGSTVITVNGSGFRPAQTEGSSSSSISINGTNATVITWSDNQITATVAAGTTTGSVKVGGFGATSNTDLVFTTANPIITSLSPSSGPVTTQVHINGSGFGTASGVVKFNGTNGTIVTWNDSQIVATPPSNGLSGAVTVTTGGVTSNGNINFTVPPPQITSITPSSGIVGTPVTINGSGFQSVTGSTIGFASANFTVNTWSDTQITATVPSAFGSNPIQATVNGVTSNKDIEFTLPSPVARSCTPTGGAVGATIQILGSGFGATQASGSTVKVNGTNASIVTWSDTVISATVATGSTSGSVVVTVGGVSSNPSPSFTVNNLFVNAVSPAAGPVGTTVTISGNGFGASQGTSTITFNNVAATVLSSNWSNTQIIANVPTGTATGIVKVTVGGTGSVGNPTFTVGAVLVTGISPTSGAPGTTIQISGSGFGTTPTGNSLTINGGTATTTSWTDGLITATVPASATTGPVKVTVGAVVSNTSVNFTVLTPIITGISPSSGPVGTSVQVTGTGFGATRGSSSLNFGAPATIVTWSDTSISATVPTNATSGRVWVTEGSVFSNMNLNFTIPGPTIVSITPTSGVVGTQVTINGSGFGAAQGSVAFNNHAGSVVTWTDTQIVANVLAGAKTGPVTIPSSNQDVVFTMPNPVVSSLSPSTGAANSSVQILGSGFGTTQGSSTVTFNGVPATAVWSDTLITATVPSTATTGVVAVSVGGVSSPSNLNFVVPPPHVTSVTPNVGTATTQITINGSGFQNTRGPGSVAFNNLVTATIVSWSDTQIVATVPVNANTGGMAVWQNQYSNWDVEFSLVSPRVTSLVPAMGPVGTQVQINGSGFGATQGSSTLPNWPTATVVSWSDAQIVAMVPATAQSGPVSVSVAGITSNNNINFTVPTPRITAISPASGVVGTNVTITGTGFQATEGSGSVCFNAGCTGTVVSWSDTQIVVAVPPNSTSGAVRVQSTSAISNQDFVFIMPNPVVASLAPASAPAGTQVQINGSGFGTTQGSSTVMFSSISGGAASIVSWSDTQIVAVVPLSTITGPVRVLESGITSNTSVDFNVPSPAITSISPTIGGIGNPITITGTGFQASQGSSSYVGFSGGGGTAQIKSWSDTQIVVIVPPFTTTGFLDVTVNTIPSNYVNYTIPAQTISSLTPSTGPVGTQVTVNGTAFGSSQGTSVLSFNGQPASVSSWTNTQIVGTVPVTAAAGPAVVTVGGINSNTSLFTVPPPIVNNTQPTGGIPNTPVTINGSGFQANQRDSTITFNGTPATVTSWSDTQIVTSVPTGASTGPLLVHVNSVASQNNAHSLFEVPYPVITSITPAEAPAGGTITITGSGFGAAEAYSPDGVSVVYTGFINFNGVQSLAQSWSDTTLVTTVPSGATSGNVTVTKYDATSNAMPLGIEGAPTVTGLSPIAGLAGGSVVVSGSGFGPTQGNSTVDFSGVFASVTDWSDTQITAVVPPGSETGPVTVTVAGISGDTQDFTIDGSVQITDSLGHVTNYVTTMVGGAWYPTLSTGSGCSTCTIRGVLNTQYDSAGRALSSTDELQHQSGFTYDADGNLTSTTVYLDANTPVTTASTYNSFGEPLTVTDPLGNVTTNTYDANGNLLTITSPVPATGISASVTQFAYDSKGELTQITDPLSHSTTLTYYPTGLIHTITDAQSNITSYEYDQRGNRTAVVDAQSNRTTFTYDSGNRLTKVTYPDTTFTTFAYDTRGRRTSVTDQNGKVTSYAYDDADRLTSVTDAALNVTTYAYDLENNLTSITDAAGHITSFVYDAFGRVTQTTFPSTLAESYVYDALGNLTSKTDRKSQTIQYVYDALNRLSHKGYPDSTGVDYVYDLVGKIKQVTDPTGSYGFAYDNMGRLIGTTTQYSFLPGTPAPTFSNSYAYDAASNRTAFTAPDGSTNAYAYDTLNRLSTLTNSLTGQFGFSYDNLNRRTALNRPNGVNTSYSYDSLSRLANVLHKAGTVTLDGAGYTYDNAGNRTAKTNYLNSITENYTYDPTYQLTQVTQGVTTTESYSYDPAGNRLSSLGMSPYAYNSSNELISTPAAAFTYDNNGNTLTKTDSSGTTTYGWDFVNRLASVVLPGTSGIVEFKYDPFGRRIRKSSNRGTTNYLYDGANSIEEVDATGGLLSRYTQGIGVDEPVAELRGGTVGYYEQDGLGSVTSVGGEVGALLNSDTYDSFGNLTASTGSFANPFQFTARDSDSETGLRYYRARYYDPSIGRFLSEDTSGFSGGDNFYNYADNSAVNLVDSQGLASAAPLPSLTPNTGGKLILIQGGNNAGKGILARLIGLLSGPIDVGIMVLSSPADGGASQELDFEARQSEKEKCAKDPNLCKVGRWMSGSELSSMEKTGRVQESRLNGVTSVTFPPNPDSYKNPPPGDMYVEFFVPCGRLRKIPGGWGKIYGPNSVFGPKLGITEMPPALGIDVFIK
jgi:RHS repeat-associated protein